MWAKVEIGYSAPEPTQQTVLEVQRNMQKVLRSAFYWILVAQGNFEGRGFRLKFIHNFKTIILGYPWFCEVIEKEIRLSRTTLELHYLVASL